MLQFFRLIERVELVVGAEEDVLHQVFRIHSRKGERRAVAHEALVDFGVSSQEAVLFILLGGHPGRSFFLYSR